MPPTLPTQVALFKGYPNMYDWTQVANIIRYDQGASYTTYSNFPALSVVTGVSGTYGAYWYGGSWRWTNTNPKHPAGITSYTTSPVGMVSTSAYGGWLNADDSGYFRRTPVRPVIGSSDKSSLPSEKRSFYSLTEYIETHHGVQNLALTAFQQYQASFVYDTQGRVSALKLSIPFSGYATPLVNIRVPTELADTWVEQPSMITAEPNGLWERTGTKHIEATGMTRLAVQVTSRETSVTGSTKVELSCSNAKVGIYPLYHVVSLAPGQTQTVYFDVTNLGVFSREDNVPIQIACKETYGGTVPNHAFKPPQDCLFRRIGAETKLARYGDYVCAPKLG